MPFTFVGRLLVLASLLLFVGCGFLFHAALPPGRYPLLFLALPSLVFTGLFFGICSAALRWANCPVWHESNRRDDMD